MHDRIALGKTGEGLLIGDICGNLARNANFDECIRLERWWDKTFQDWLTNGLKITIVCPYTRSEGLTASHVHIKQRISNLHTATVSEITRWNRDWYKRNLRFLLLTNRGDTLEFVVHNLQKRGHSVTGFTSPYDALAFFQDHNEQYQVVLSDIRMSEMNGFKFSRRILSINPGAKVFLLTSFEINKSEFVKVMPSLKGWRLFEKASFIRKIGYRSRAQERWTHWSAIMNTLMAGLQLCKAPAAPRNLKMQRKRAV